MVNSSLFQNKLMMREAQTEFLVAEVSAQSPHFLKLRLSSRSASPWPRLDFWERLDTSHLWTIVARNNSASKYRNSLEPWTQDSGRHGQVSRAWVFSLSLHHRQRYRKVSWNVPGGPLVKTSPTSAGSTGSFPGRGTRSHMPQGQKTKT